MTVTDKIASFIDGLGKDGLPVEALPKARSALMDYVGVTIAGICDPSAAIVRKVVGSMGGYPQATIWGQDGKTSLLLAALANGTAAHALDLDDTNPLMMSHPSVQLLPGLFAMGESRHITGREMILAYITGFETGARLGKALNPRLVYQGWFPVGVLGSIMQTVACAKLIGLDKEKIEMALGIAANLASGLRSNNGTMAKPLMAGKVGVNGILAALLAAEGMTANPGALEARFGFFDNFTRGELSDLQEAFESPGAPLNILESGVSFKLYPCCAGTHMPIDAALELVKNHHPDPHEILKIEVSVGSYVKFLLIHPRPQTEAQAKFSLEYCVARAFLDGRIGPEQFHAEKIKEPQLLNLIEKVSPRYSDSTPLEGAKRPPADVTIYMKSGEVYSTRVNEARGTAANPLTRDELEEKFHACCRGMLTEPGIVAAKEKLNNFEEIRDVSEFVSLLNRNILEKRIS